jgi:hypothetical protein
MSVVEYIWTRKPLNQFPFRCGGVPGVIRVLPQEGALPRARGEPAGSRDLTDGNPIRTAPMASAGGDAGVSRAVSFPGEQAERRAAGIRRTTIAFMLFTM